MATYPVAVHVKAKDSASDVIARTSRRIGRSLSDVRRNATSASSAISSVGSTIRESSGRALLYGVGALGAGMVGAGIAAKGWAEDALEVSGELVDFRAKTGFAIEALQEWRYAASQSGVETGTFNAAVMNLSKQLGPLRSGTGKLAKYTKDTLNPALLKQVQATTSTEEALGLYVAALEGIEDPAKRAAAAQVIFGRAGKDMAALAAAGSVEIKALRDQKRQDGVMSTDAAEKNEALGDGIERLKGQYGQFTTTIGTEFLKALTPHLEGLGQWFTANQGVIGQNVAGGVDALAESMKSIDWDAIASGAGKVWGAVEKIAGFAADAYANMRELYNLGEELGDKVAGEYDSLKAGLGMLAGSNVVNVDETGAVNPNGSRQRLVTPQEQAAALQRANDLKRSLGMVPSVSDKVVAENAAALAGQLGDSLATQRRRVSERGSGLTRDGGGIFGRARDAMSQQRTAAERLDALPYGLGAVHTAGPPAPPQEVVVKIETTGGTTATVTKQPTASNVKVGARRVGAGE